MAQPFFPDLDFFLLAFCDVVICFRTWRLRDKNSRETDANGLGKPIETTLSATL